jgi:hypothetical protein
MSAAAITCGLHGRIPWRGTVMCIHCRRVWRLTFRKREGDELDEDIDLDEDLELDADKLEAVDPMERPTAYGQSEVPSAAPPCCDCAEVLTGKDGSARPICETCYQAAFYTQTLTEFPKVVVS